MIHPFLGTRLKRPGYGAKTIPAEREAIEQREYAMVDPQIEIAADVLPEVQDLFERSAFCLGPYVARFEEAFALE